MKKNILTAILLLLSVSAMAQDEKEIDNGYRLYVQAHVFGNYSAGEDLRYNKFKDALNWGGDFEFGYNFNDFWGLYAEIAYNKNKGATSITYGHPDIIYSFNSYEPSLNVTYNITNGVFGYKPGRRNNFYLHLGPTVAFREKIDFQNGWNVEDPADLDKKTVWGGKLGINYVYNFNNWVAFTADLTGSIFGDKLNGRNDRNVAVDGRLNLGVGLRVYLNKSSKPAIGVRYLDEVVLKHDTIRTQEIKYVNDVDLYPVFFASDKTAIESAQATVIKTVADKLKSSPSRIVYVIGYADKNSDTPKNVNALAKDRADNITNELINKYGIDPDRIVEHDMGSSVTPYMSTAEKNRSTICIVTDLKHE